LLVVIEEIPELLSTDWAKQIGHGIEIELAKFIERIHCRHDLANILLIYSWQLLEELLFDFDFSHRLFACLLFIRTSGGTALKKD